MRLNDFRFHFNRVLKPLCTIASVVLISGLAAIPQAQANTAQNSSRQWYQVEVFIFANTDSGAAGSEQWPEGLSLRYPSDIVSLKLPETTDLQSTDAALTPGIQQAVSSTPGADDQAFLLLPPEQHQLKRAVKRILAQRDFRLLFHGAWRQVIGKRNKSASLLIRGGDAYDQHYELEGSINLSVERYLHINTDLWFSSFASNSGIDNQLWPVLPRLPASIAPVLNQSGELFTEQNNAQINFDNATDSSLETSLQQSLQSPFDFDNPFQEMRNNQYSVDRTVVMRQHRRMRSNELHYIDHPMMGLLIKIVPYNFPQNDKQ